MSLTQEKAKVLTEFLAADEQRARELMSLDANEALMKINGGQGVQYTLDELKEYGSVLSQATAVSDDQLEGVAGGFVRPALDRAGERAGIILDSVRNGFGTAWGNTRDFVDSIKDTVSGIWR